MAGLGLIFPQTVLLLHQLLFELIRLQQAFRSATVLTDQVTVFRVRHFVNPSVEQPQVKGISQVLMLA